MVGKRYKFEIRGAIRKGGGKCEQTEKKLALTIPKSLFGENLIRSAIRLITFSQLPLHSLTSSGASPH